MKKRIERTPLARSKVTPIISISPSMSFAAIATSSEIVGLRIGASDMERVWTHRLVSSQRARSLSWQPKSSISLNLLSVLFEDGTFRLLDGNNGDVVHEFSEDTSEESPLGGYGEWSMSSWNLIQENANHSERRKKDAAMADSDVLSPLKPLPTFRYIVLCLSVKSYFSDNQNGFDNRRSATPASRSVRSVTGMPEANVSTSKGLNSISQLQLDSYLVSITNKGYYRIRCAVFVRLCQVNI